LHGAAARFATHGDPVWLLADIDNLFRGYPKKDLFSYLVGALEPVRGKPGVAPLLARVQALADAAIPLASAVAQRFGPLVEERLRARKRAAGLYDFDDMLILVEEALRGPRGAELAATLRARFRIAVIDEFQDTDPVQWQIFRTIFLQG